MSEIKLRLQPAEIWEIRYIWTKQRVQTAVLMNDYQMKPRRLQLYFIAVKIQVYPRKLIITMS